MELVAVVDTISPRTAVSCFGPPVSSSRRVRWGSRRGGGEHDGWEGGVDVVVGEGEVGEGGEAAEGGGEWAGEGEGGEVDGGDGGGDGVAGDAVPVAGGGVGVVPGGKGVGGVGEVELGFKEEEAILG